MTENTNTDPKPASDTAVNTDPAPSGGGGDSTDWRKEAEKWKALSRKHEDAEKALKSKLAQLEQASMSDAEKAAAAARKEGETSALRKVSERLARAELKAQAAEKGVKLPPLDALNLAKFTTEDGDPDEEAIADFVSSLTPVGKKFADPKDLGIGPQGGNDGRPRQWKRSELQGKTHQEIHDAREKGHLDDILAGKD